MKCLLVYKQKYNVKFDFIRVLVNQEVLNDFLVSSNNGKNTRGGFEYLSAIEIRQSSHDIDGISVLSSCIERKHTDTEKEFTNHIKTKKYNFETYISEINNKCLNEITSQIFSRSFQNFLIVPASRHSHNKIIEGLSRHTENMIKISELVLDIYPMFNRDFLIAGIILHDIGKIIERPCFNCVSHNLEKYLIDHISKISGVIDIVAKENGWTNRKELIVLKHIVLSHHGKYEYGSPVLPHILEAEVVSLIDGMEAKLSILAQIFEDTDNGNFSKESKWFDNRKFFILEEGISQ